MSPCKDVGRKHTGCILAPICFITNADHWQWYVLCGEMVTDWAKPQLQFPLTGSITCTLLFYFPFPCPLPPGSPLFPPLRRQECKWKLKKKKKKKKNLVPIKPPISTNVTGAVSRRQVILSTRLTVAPYWQDVTTCFSLGSFTWQIT